MLAYILLFWILKELAAPIWCWVVFGAALTFKLLFKLHEKAAENRL